VPPGADHATVTFVAAPVSSFSGSGAELANWNALFQLAFATTPAV
jgi:hypothetical protein